MYQLLKLNEFNQTPECIIRTSDNACIPFDPANTDFVEYQKWLELGNEPLPAENE